MFYLRLSLVTALVTAHTGEEKNRPLLGGGRMSSSRRMPGENLKGPIVGDFESIAELREHLYQRCQNRCKTRAHAKQLVLT